jgi:predicted RND superfamily exporter protein
MRNHWLLEIKRPQDRRDKNKINKEYSMSAQKIIRSIIMKPALCLTLALILLLISIGFALNVHKNTTPYFMHKAHPERLKEDALSNVFSRSKETIVIVFESIEGDVFTAKGLQLLTEIHQSLSGLDLIELLPQQQQMAREQLIKQYNRALSEAENAAQRKLLEKRLGQFIYPIRSIKSLLNSDDIYETEEDIVVAPNFHEALLEEWQRDKGKTVLSNPLLVKSLIDENGKALAVQLELTIDPDDSDSTEAMFRKIQDVVTPIAQKLDFKSYYAGTPVVNVEISRIMEKDNQRYFPLIILVISLILFSLYRNFWAPLLALSVSIISIALTFGLMTMLGISLNIVTTILPIFIITIGVTDAIHLLSKSKEEQGLSIKEAIVFKVSKLYRAMLLTSLTTALGFFSLSFTDIINIQEFGIMVGLSTLIAFLISVTVLPALMSLIGFQAKAGIQGFMVFHKIENLARRQSDRRALAVVGLLLVVALIGVNYFYVDQQNLNSFNQDTQVRQDDQRINHLLGGTIPVTLWLHSEDEKGVLSGSTLAFIEQLEAVGRAHDIVGYTVSLPGFLRRMHQVMFPENAAEPVSSLSPELIAQYLFLLEGGASRDLESVLELGQYQQTRLVLMSHTDGSADLQSLIDDLQKITDNPPHGITVKYAGYGNMNAVAAQEIVLGQLNSILLSVLGLVLLISLIYRSLKTGLIVIFPLSMSLLMMFGMMGLFTIPLDIGSSLVCGVAFGIGIDYSIHIVEAYIRERKAMAVQGAKLQTQQEIVMKAMSEVSFPILTSAFTISAGFAVLLVSEFKPIFNLGLLVSSTMLISAFVTLFVLPSLLRFIPEANDAPDPSQ